MPRRKAVKDVLKDIGTIKPQPEETSEPVEEKTVEEKVVQGKSVEVPSIVSFSIPSEKVPVQLKEMPVGSEVTLQITGNIDTSDETGITLSVKTIEVV